MSEEPRPGTTASLDRRVERLEAAQGDMAHAIERVEIEQKHSRDLADLRFSGLEQAINGQGGVIRGLDAKLDQMLAGLQQTALEGQRLMGDPTATPAGRQVMQDLNDLKQGREENRAAIVGLQLSVAKGAGAITVILALLTLFGPAIRHLFGLPT